MLAITLKNVRLLANKATPFKVFPYSPISQSFLKINIIIRYTSSGSKLAKEAAKALENHTPSITQASNSGVTSISPQSVTTSVQPTHLGKSESSSLPYISNRPNSPEKPGILKTHEEAQKGFNSPSLSETVKNNSYLQGQSKVTTSLTSPKDQEIGKEIVSRSMAVWNVRTPGVFKDSHEQTQNNEITTIWNGKKKRYLQHPEITRTTCNFPGCNGIICSNLCGKFDASQGVGHVTHHVPADNIPTSKVGDKVIATDGKTFTKISDTDFDKNLQEQFVTVYPNPHDVNPTDIDQKKTEALNNNPQALEEIIKNAN